MTESQHVGPRELDDRSVPNAARVYDYYLGGLHNFTADREFAQQIFTTAPTVPAITRQNRSFLTRVVDYYLDEGITQFLDIGSGVPTVGNVHEVAQRRIPDAKIVYVDYEPVAANAARDLLADNPNATILHADLRDPDAILNHPETLELLDFTRPLGLLMVGVLLFVPDEDDPAGLVARYRDVCAPGSLLAISHITDEHAPPELKQEMARFVGLYDNANEHIYPRNHAELVSWFAGTELVEPGVTRLCDWRPVDAAEAEDPAAPLGYGGVGRVL
ncbi:MAG TPA: SAM-dependent methyltransferase [Pseudonocardiaceae bacterium]|nr:SAM-dependent methyltransferase [Pseudonocardiaceae bacterium]